MVEEEPRAVDQRPRQILDHRQAFVFALLAAGLGVLPQLHQIGVEVDGFFRLAERLLQLG